MGRTSHPDRIKLQHMKKTEFNGYQFGAKHSSNLIILLFDYSKQLHGVEDQYYQQRAASTDQSPMIIHF